MRRALPALLLALLVLGGCRCGDPCLGIECPGGEVCLDGACVADPVDGGTRCNIDDQCAGLPNRTHCEPASGTCVQCINASHCPEPERQVCNPASHTCAPRPPCTDDSACLDLPATPYCETASGACVVCTEDAQCPGDQRVCSGFTCRFDACIADADCAEDPERPFCQTSTGRCRACTLDAHCPEGEACVSSACQPTGACARDADCPVGGRCDLAADPPVCVQCITSDHCRLGGRCLSGACTSARVCAGDADCAPLDRCDIATAACVACSADAHCARGQRCASGACAAADPCGADAFCLEGQTCASGACADESCADDAFEPNDAPYQATVIAPGTYDAVACANDWDWYVASADSRDGVDLELTYDPASGHPSLLVWAAGGTGPVLLGQPVRTATGQRLELPSLTRVGPVWIGVRGLNAALPYALRLSVVPGGLCEDDVLEDNDGPSQATVLPDPVAGVTSGEAVACFADDDWYVVTTPAGQRTVALAEADDGQSSSLAVSLFVQESGGTLRLVGGSGTNLAEAPARSVSTPHLVRVTQTVLGRKPYRLTVRLRPPRPSNDTCAGAGILVEGVSRDGTTAGANDDGATACGGAGSADVVYRFTLEVPRRVKVGTTGSLDAVLALQATCGVPESEVACSDHPGDVEAVSAVLPAGTHYVWVDGFGGREGSYRIELFTADPPLPPPNEDCATAERLDVAAGGGVAQGDLALADDALALSCGAAGGEAVWLLELESAASLSATLEGADGLSVAVQGSCGDEATEQGCAGSGGALELPYLEAGTWALVVDGGGPARGPFTLTWALGSPIPPPPNEDCARAEPLAFTGDAVQVSGDTRNAADDHQAACATAASGGDVVYTFALLEERQLIASLSAGFDAVLALRGTPCAEPSSGLACSDHSPPRLHQPALPVGVYHLLVDGYDGGRGPFTLDVALAAPLPVPGNDLCAAATLLDGSAGTVVIEGYTLRAGDDEDPGLACTGSPAAGPDVFYVLELLAGQTLTAQVVPEPGYDVALYLLGGCDAAVCLAGSDASFVSDPEALTYTAPADGPVLVVVDGFSAAQAGTFQLQIGVQ